MATIASGCSSSQSSLLSEDPGGDTTTPLNNRNAFGSPAPNLTPSDRRTFEIGDSFFTQPWVTAPSSTDARDGLGALFNASSCSSCHLLDGRGAPPSDRDDPERGLLLRIGVANGTDIDPHPTYGDQLQDRAIDDVPVEGTITIEYEEVVGTYADGTSYTLRAPTYSIVEPGYGAFGEILISPRIAPVVFGMGLVEAILEADIVANADPDDRDDDGISGRPNFVMSASRGRDMLGRFGWKANVATVEDQVAGAFVGDIGITSPVHPTETCTTAQPDCLGASTGGSPELTADRLAKVVFYGSTLAVPQRRDLEEATVKEGAELFETLTCTACHISTFVTGDHEIEAVADQRITPFSDFLLHDMGEGLADGKPDGRATGSEWRTAPLWGLGLIEEVNGHTFLLHDGRARSIEEAILWHGGEALGAQQAFIALDSTRRAQVVAFLESL